MPCVLSFAKPEPAEPYEKWSSYVADGAPPGVYSSNMSEEDKLRWKAKLVGIRSKAYQIEIRTEEPGANLVLVVNGERNHPPEGTPPAFARHAAPGAVKFSANGPTYYDPRLWEKLDDAVKEARLVLKLLDRGGPEEQSALEAIRKGKNPFEVTL
jgi:hypothetical protein